MDGEEIVGTFLVAIVCLCAGIWLGLAFKPQSEQDLYNRAYINCVDFQYHNAKDVNECTKIIMPKQNDIN